METLKNIINKFKFGKCWKHTDCCRFIKADDNQNALKNGKRELPLLYSVIFSTFSTIKCRKEK